MSVSGRFDVYFGRFMGVGGVRGVLGGLEGGVGGALIGVGSVWKVEMGPLWRCRDVLMCILGALGGCWGRSGCFGLFGRWCWGFGGAL